MAGFAFGPTGDRIADIFCDLTFGLGTSLISAGVTEAVKDVAQQAKTNTPEEKPLVPGSLSPYPQSSGGIGGGYNNLMISYGL